jgi:hypothetical protein
MYDQLQGETLYIIFYSIVTATAMIACCYLLFRRSNAIAPDITPPIRLRRWTAVFFAFITLSHLWYMPMAFLSSSNHIMIAYYIGVLLDCMIIIPLAIIVLLAMLRFSIGTEPIS